MLSAELKCTADLSEYAHSIVGWQRVAEPGWRRPQKEAWATGRASGLPNLKPEPWAAPGLSLAQPGPAPEVPA